MKLGPATTLTGIGFHEIAWPRMILVMYLPY
jgi:hypothetical protein